MTTPKLSLIVIRSADVEASLNFYKALHLTFVEEQHGSGPVHYSTDLAGIVMEIYPVQVPLAHEPNKNGTVMLGLQIESLTATLGKLKDLHIEPKTPPRDSEWGRWVNVVDPDGRTIQLIQAKGD